MGGGKNQLPLGSKIPYSEKIDVNSLLRIIPAFLCIHTQLLLMKLGSHYTYHFVTCPFPNNKVKIIVQVHKR